MPKCDAAQKADAQLETLRADLTNSNGTREALQALANFYDRWRTGSRRSADDPVVAAERLWMFACKKHSALAAGVEFTIQLYDFDFPTRCPVFDTPMRLGGPLNDSPTLSRLNSSRGYVPGNVVVVSRRAARMKGDAGWWELREVSEFYRRLAQARR